MSVLAVVNLSKSYRSASETVTVLRGVNLRVAAGERVALTGESGSGKSTLLHLIAGLDLITFFFAYHDITYMPVDRAVMNKKMFDALKPGGFLIMADHSAKPGEGITVAKTLHRIEETTLRQEIEAARGENLQQSLVVRGGRRVEAVGAVRVVRVAVVGTRDQRDPLPL